VVEPFSAHDTLSIKQWSCVYREGGTRIYTQALVPFNTFRTSSSASALRELELLLTPARYKGNSCTFYDSRLDTLESNDSPTHQLFECYNDDMEGHDSGMHFNSYFDSEAHLTI